MPTDAGPRFDPGTPYTGTELLGGMRAMTADAESYLRAIPPDEFARPQGDRWSPGDHARHLAKSSFALVKGLKAPRFMLRVLFGAPKRASRRFLPLREDYRTALGAGGQANRFAPEAKPLPDDLGSWQRDVIARWRAAADALHEQVALWDEVALDRYAIKHPLMGPLTVREMLMFSHYHESHHLNLLAARRAG